MKTWFLTCVMTLGMAVGLVQGQTDPRTQPPPPPQPIVEEPRTTTVVDEEAVRTAVPAGVASEKERQAPQAQPQVSLRAPAVTVDPRTLPLFNPSTISYSGKITIPGRDSKGNLINYGAGASGFSENGTEMFVACHSLAGNVANYDARGRIWRGTIPAIGQMSKEIAPCTGLADSELVKISGVAGMQSPLVGSVIQRAGRYILGGYITYDASGQNPRKTWWTGPSLAQLTGPVEGSVRNGLVKGNTTPIPPEWQPLLGGDVGVGDQFSSIISRGSYGAAFTTFWAQDVAPGFAMNLLLGCPSNDPVTGTALPQCTNNYTEGTQDLAKYNGAEKIGATFIVPGTRTLMVELREAKGPMCYGYATTNKALHGTVKPGPEQVHWCYSLSGDPNNKGMHAFPYVHLGLLFDLNDAVAVKQGKMKPWDVKPYATHQMPNSNDFFDIGYTGTGAFNPKTGQYFLFREAYPNGSGGADVEVYAGWPTDTSGPPPPPVDRDCVFTTTVTTGPFLPAACPAPPAKPERFATETTTITVIDQPVGKGKACPATTTRQVQQDCVYAPPPPPATISCEVRGVPSPYADKDARLTVRCDTNGSVTIPRGTKFTIPMPGK